jgi:hypothetical protein|tara:strand:+ start:973 stop:1176 length:204 start_codon:yes stop_codon:yes gene_type:complete
MAMMYGDIDKSREKRNDLNLIITNLTKVIRLTEYTGGKHNAPYGLAEEIEILIKDALDSALKLKGDN